MPIKDWCFTIMLGASSGLCGCAGSQPAPSTESSQPSGTSAVEPTQPSRSAAAAQPLGGKPQADMPPSGSSLDRVMRAHFKDALLIRQAVIAGTPDEAVMPARVLASIENLDDVPPDWRAFVERMQQTARGLAPGSSTAQAAVVAANLGVTCGDCHRQQGGPAVSNALPPAEGATLERRMNRHVWAMDRLWEGLVVPSGEAWSAGSKALVDSPLPDEASLLGNPQTGEAASAFKSLAAQASSKRTAEERAALYAGLLTTCGTCHRARSATATK
jgi:cytochrome c553